MGSNMGTPQAWWHSMTERDCPCCGKKFQPTDLWVYKEGKKIFCSWGCLQKYRFDNINDLKRPGYPRPKKKDLTKEEVDVIRRALKMGMTMRNIAELLGISYARVLYHRDKIAREEG